MNKFRTLLTLLLLLCLMPGAATAQQGDAFYWDIAKFATEIDLNADGTYEVTEIITANFKEQRRGIIRLIPYTYRRNGTEYRVRLTVLGVTDGKQRDLTYVQSRSNGMLSLKIGDAERWLEGRQVYRIRYRVARGILYFEERDELYWNATGTEWTVPIGEASCMVRLPGNTDPTRVITASYIGSFGSEEHGQPTVIDDEGALRFSAGRPLDAWEGLTVVVGVPKGTLAPVSKTMGIAWFIEDNWVLLIPILTFMFLFTRWWSTGRDHGTQGSVAVQYQPPEGLTPLEVGTLIDERCDTGDLTASIVGLGVRGYLTIKGLTEEREAGTLRLIRTAKPDTDLKGFEKKLLTGLFEEGDDVGLESLECKFFTHLSGIQESVYRELVTGHYFAHRPDKVREVYEGGGCLFGVFGLIACIVISTMDLLPPLSLWLAFVLTVIQPFFFGPQMPRRTAKGRKALEGIRGLEEFIRRAELPQLEQAARQAQFEQLLPFAFALNMADQWGKKFEGLYLAQPDWYQVPGNQQFSSYWLTRDLSRSMAVMDHSLTVAPRTESSSGGWSSGGGGGGFSGFSGGSSGGGFGGGGGSSW